MYFVMLFFFNYLSIFRDFGSNEIYVEDVLKKWFREVFIVKLIIFYEGYKVYCFIFYVNSIFYEFYLFFLNREREKEFVEERWIL